MIRFLNRFYNVIEKIKGLFFLNDLEILDLHSNKKHFKSCKAKTEAEPVPVTVEKKNSNSERKVLQLSHHNQTATGGSELLWIV